MRTGAQLGKLTLLVKANVLALAGVLGDQFYLIRSPFSSINAVASACPQAELSVQRKLLQEVSRYLADASTALEQLKPLMGRVDSIDGVKEMALAYHDAVVPAMDALRYPIDTLELMVDKSICLSPPTAI